MSNILVVDDMAIFRDPIAMSLRAEGYTAVCAANGRDALQSIKASRPDLILLDLGMPVMDGVQFLRALRADPDAAHIPVICLTAQTDRSRVVEVAKLGVRDYMLKSRFSISDLLARIRKGLETPADGADSHRAASIHNAPSVQPPAASSSPATATTTGRPSQPGDLPRAPIAPSLTREQALQRIDSAAQNKTINGLAAKVMAVAAAPESDLNHLAALIARDPTLSARALRAANSVLWGNKSGVIVSLPDAIRMMGFAAIRNLAASAAVLDMAPAAFSEGFSAGRWWSHTLAVAVMAERLASASAQPAPCPAYLAGLCHDLAQLVLHDCFAREYQTIGEAHRTTGKPLHDLERSMLGISANELSAHVISRFGLPEAIGGPIDAFHKAVRTGTHPVDPLARILWLSETYCNGILLASTTSSLIRPFTRALCKQFLGTDSPAAPAAEQFRNEILGLTLALAHLSAQDESEMTRPLLRRFGAGVWLAREPSFSAFDPLQAAISSIADVTVSDRLPSVAEAKASGVLIASSATSSRGFMPDDIAQLEDAGVPLLWLTEKVDAPVPRTLRVKPKLCPISLQSIEDFARACQKGATAPQVAPTIGR